MLQQLARRSQRAAVLAHRCCGALTASGNSSNVLRRFSSNSGNSASAVPSSATPAAVSPRPAQPHAAAAAQPSKLVQQTSTTVIPIGYGVGQFELELTKGAPQLWADTPETAVTELESVPLAAAAAAFDLSYVPAPQGDVSQLRGSWAADKTATSSMEPKLREQEELEKRQRQQQQEGQHHEPQQPPPQQHQQQQQPQQASFERSNEQQRSSMRNVTAAENATPIRQPTQVGQQQDPFAALRASLHNAPPDFFDAPPPSPTAASALPSAPVADVATPASSPAAPVAPTFVPAGSAVPVPVPADASSDAPASAASTRSYIDRPKSQLPLEMRLVLEGSIILFQNFIFCWSPKTCEEVNSATLGFLRVLTPKPELILLGTGVNTSMRLAPDAQQLLDELKIGVEIMDTGNAIATYNILHNEGRTVLAALVQKAEPPVVERKLTRSQQMRAKLGYWQF